MKRIFLILFILLAFLGVSSAQDKPASLPGAQDTALHNFWHTFTGQWMPNIDPSIIGAKNYKTLQNLRYTDGGLEGVQGYSKINTSVVNATNLKIRNGYQLKKDEPEETHVLVQAYNTGLTTSKVYENPTAIPDQGDFTATELHTDASGAGTGRFSSGAQGTVFYCNGVESKVYGGDESRVAAFVTSTAAITDTITDPKDFTNKVQNKLQTADEVVNIGGGNDSYTELLLHMNGPLPSTDFTDSSSNSIADTPHGDAKMADDQLKFGGASGYFDGDGDYVTYPDDDGVSDYWFMSTGRFTIDFWVRFKTMDQNYYGIFDQYVDGSNSVSLFYNHGNGRWDFYVKSGGSTTVTINATYAASTDTWYHIALIRGWGDNDNQWAITVDGTQIGSTVTDSDAWPDLAGPLLIGDYTQGGGADWFEGWLDEFRVSKGIARWTSNFTPPARAYHDDSLYWVIGSTRPLEGVKFYVSEANTTASTLTGEEWNGVSWDSLSITDNTDTGASLAQTGTVTWSSTEDTSKPKYLEGLYLYWYQFYLDDGQADIYYTTVDTGFQDVVDIWDGVYRQPIAFQAQRNNEWEDYTLEINTETETSDYPFVATLGGIDSNDQIIVMFDDRITAIKFQMLAGLTNDTASTLTIYYWDGSGWIQVSNLVDLTLDDTGSTDTLNKTGVVSWTPPDEALEFPREKFGVKGYSYKIVSSGVLDDGTAHDGTSVDVVTGIPAQLKIPPFKFPAKYNNRTMLCGFTESNEGNRIDYSLPNAPDVFNGEETSNGGVYSLYFGSGQELSAATELYNRFGSNIFSTLVVLKDTETYLLTGNTPDMESTDRFRIFPISYNIGCPAPLTLATAELGYEVAADAQRNVAIWLSYSGPILFDGAVIVPLKGIENYFDPAETECINFDYISAAVGAYDETNREYNLLIPSGAAQTTNNVWLVYDLIRKKWFQKDTGIGFEDSSSTNHSLTTGGNARIDVTEAKLGTASGYFDGTSDYITTPNHADWDIQTNFTISLFVKHTDHVGYEFYVSQYEDVNNRWTLYHLHGEGIYFSIISGGASIVGTGNPVANGGEITNSDWNHVLLAKVGNEYGVYLNGNEVSYTNDADIDTFTGDLIIGQRGDASNYFDGYMDEVRIYHGNPFNAAPNVGLTDTITVPTKPHTPDSNTKLLLHMDSGGAIGMPQSMFSVTDTSGTRYIYGGLDTGYMMYVEDGNDWDGTAIGQVVETGDFFPADNNPWYKTRFRRLKLAAASVTEDTDVYITHYDDTSYSGTSLDVLALDSGSDRIVRGTQNLNLLGWSHRLKFAAETSDTKKGMRPIGWGCQYRIEREDL